MAKVLVVTGGSRGIGAAICALAGRRDYAVAVNYNAHADRAKAVVDEIVRGGGKAIAVKADVSDRKQVVAMFEEVDRRLGPLDALVNNAGTNGKVVPFADIEDATFREVYETNLFGFVPLRAAGGAPHVEPARRARRRDRERLVGRRAHRRDAGPRPLRLLEGRGRRVRLLARARGGAAGDPRRDGAAGDGRHRDPGVFKGTGVLEKALATVPLGRMGRARGDRRSRVPGCSRRRRATSPPRRSTSPAAADAAATFSGR